MNMIKSHGHPLSRFISLASNDARSNRYSFSLNDSKSQRTTSEIAAEAARHGHTDSGKRAYIEKPLSHTGKEAVAPLPVAAELGLLFPCRCASRLHRQTQEDRHSLQKGWDAYSTIAIMSSNAPVHQRYWDAM